MSSSKRILLINPFGIGDVLFTTPVISQLRASFPDAFIGYVANRRSAPVIQSNPKVNQVFIYERDEFKKDLIQSWRKLFNDIRSSKFDLVFDFSLNSSFGFFSMICGIKRRIGYDYKKRGRFLTDQIPLEGYEGRHVVEYYLDLIKALEITPLGAPKMEIFVDESCRQWAKEWMSRKKIPLDKPIVAVVPGGGASWGKEAVHKRWPIREYASLLDKMIEKSKVTIILMGDSKETSLCQELTRQCSYPIYDAVGETNLLQMAALFQLCSLAIVNDGGPLHVAVASGVKTVSIFGPVDPVIYGPYPRDKHIVITKNLACQPCYRQFRKASCSHISCLRDLSAEEVFNYVVGAITNRPYVAK